MQESRVAALLRRSPRLVRLLQLDGRPLFDEYGNVNTLALAGGLLMWLMIVWFANLLSTIPMALLTGCDTRGVVGWAIAQVTGETRCPFVDWDAERPDYF